MFRKIRQTVQALRPRRSVHQTPTIAELHEANRRTLEEHRRRTYQTEGAARPNIGVVFGVILPLSLILSRVLSAGVEQVVQPQTASIGTISRVTTGFVTVSVSYLSGLVHSSLHQILPFSKLNPYFGHKIDRTAAAFKLKHS